MNCIDIIFEIFNCHGSLRESYGKKRRRRRRRKRRRRRRRRRRKRRRRKRWRRRIISGMRGYVLAVVEISFSTVLDFLQCFFALRSVP
jgi:polyferredoxin